MSALALLGAFGTLLGAGYGLLTLLARKETQLSLTEQIAFSWLLGTGAVSLLLWIFGLFVHGVLLPGLVSIICLSLGLVGWRRKVPRPLRCMPNLFEIFLGIIVFLEIAIVFYLSFVHTLGWDGLLNWEIKAHYAFANGGVIPATYFTAVAPSVIRNIRWPFRSPSCGFIFGSVKPTNSGRKSSFQFSMLSEHFWSSHWAGVSPEKHGLGSSWRPFCFLSHRLRLKSGVQSLVTQIFR